MRTSTTLLVLAVILAATGCFESSSLEDAGLDGGALAGWDANAPPECVVSGYVRCDRECAGTCPSETADAIQCNDRNGLCLPKFTEPPQSCVHSAPIDPANHPDACFSGEPCVGHAAFEGLVAGTCLPPSLCLELRAAGRTELRCNYPDRTELVVGPPDATCPASVDNAPFCAGACGAVACPTTNNGFDLEYGGCMGLSDERGFGVCAFSSRMLGRADILDLNCPEFYGAPCAIMVLRPLPPDAPLFGWLVLGEACARYRDAYPEGVECYGEDWTPL